MTLLPKDSNFNIIQEDRTSGDNQLFPVFIKLNELHTVLIGAGNIGLEKLTAIVNNSPLATVTIIARTFLPEVHAVSAEYPGVKILQKTFEESDLNNANLVIAATNDNALNEYIVKVAHEHNLLVNIADKPALCDFYLGSIVQKGDLKLAISTNGKSPTVAKRIKEVLNESIPDEIDDTLQQIAALRQTLTGDFAYKVKKLNEVTSILVDNKKNENSKKGIIWLIWGAIILATGIALASFWFKEPAFKSYVQSINPLFYYFLGGGFLFALVDGAIGMSYGVTATSFSLTMGIVPAVASLGVHLSEILSNGIAGWMHYRMGNINWKLFWMLLWTGIIGAVTGAYILSSLTQYSQYTKPFVSLYTLILGLIILFKAFKLKRKRNTEKIKRIPLLGLGGGFIDAVGGGGWGSIVLSTLIAGGRSPRFSLGTVKLSRFFIALTSSVTFIYMLHVDHWEAVGGLVIGSALASPIAAKISNRISTKVIMISVAVIVILISVNSIWHFLAKVI